MDDPEGPEREDEDDDEDEPEWSLRRLSEDEAAEAAALERGLLTPEDKSDEEEDEQDD